MHARPRFQGLDRLGGPSVDAVWARYYIEHALHDLYHWAERLGVKWVDLKVQEGNSVMRWTRPERNGLGLMTHLIESFRNKGGEIIPETEITGLRLEGGRVTGLEGCNAKTSEPVAVSSKAVVVATGGFNSNLEMVLEFNPALGNHKVLEGSGPGSTGSGHKFIRQAGGYLMHMDQLVLRLRHAGLSGPRAATRPRVPAGAWQHLGQSAGPPVSQ